MGDRTSAYLRLFGEVKKHLLPRLAELLDRPDEWDEEELAKGGDVRIDCEEVNHGSMEDEFGGAMRIFLEGNGISYIWCWGSGYDYMPGISVWTPEFGGDFNTDGDEIVLTVRQLSNSVAIDRARKAQEICQRVRLLKVVEADSPAVAS